MDAELADAKFRAGQRLGTFQHWGTTFGIEICYDHSNAVLYNQLQAGGKLPVDVHLIVSSTVPNQGGKVAARTGGLLVHADGQDVRTSHQQQPGTSGAKTGVWEVQERANPRGGGTGSTMHKQLNRGQYIDLERRKSFTRAAADVPVAQQFEGFDDDVSVYRVTL